MKYFLVNLADQETEQSFVKLAFNGRWQALNRIKDKIKHIKSENSSASSSWYYLNVGNCEVFDDLESAKKRFADPSIQPENSRHYRVFLIIHADEKTRKIDTIYETQHNDFYPIQLNELFDPEGKGVTTAYINALTRSPFSKEDLSKREAFIDEYETMLQAEESSDVEKPLNIPMIKNFYTQQSGISFRGLTLFASNKDFHSIVQDMRRQAAIKPNDASAQTLKHFNLAAPK